MASFSKDRFEYFPFQHGILEAASVVVPVTAEQEHAPTTAVPSPEDLLFKSALLATFIDSYSLPYRRSNGLAKTLTMGAWASILSPRQDLRVIASEMCLTFDPLTFDPLSPCVTGSPKGRWSRLMVGRGVGLELWPDRDLRAVRFPYDSGVLVPRSFPPGVFDAAEGTSRQMLVSAGASDALYPWLAELARPFKPRGAAEQAASQASSMDHEDSSFLCEEITALSEAYST